MTAPSIFRTCLQCLKTPKPPSVSASLASRNASQRSLHYHAPTPVSLDFLAPSWRPGTCLNERPTNLRQPNHSSLHHRCFTSSSRRRAVAIQNARKDESGNDMVINITGRAAHRLQAIAATDNNSDLALRVSVESGGCHGFQYLMSLTNLREADPEEDTVFEQEERVSSKDEGEYKAKVVMDEASLELLKGSSVDYTMELIGSQFKVTGIPGAKSSCGCGTSFDIAA